MENVAIELFGSLSRKPRLIQQYEGPKSSFANQLKGEQESLNKIRREFLAIKPKINGSPLLTDDYFTHSEAVQIQAELIVALTALILRIKNSIPKLEEPETLEEQLAWNSIQITYKFYESASKSLINQARALMLEIDNSVEIEGEEEQNEVHLDEYWEEQEKEFNEESKFIEETSKRKEFQQIRRNILEVKAIQDIFMEQLSSQGNEILRIYDLNVSSEQNMERANKFVIRAKKNLQDSTKISVVLMIIAISGLWWIDAVRK